MNIVKRIQNANRNRDPARLAMKYHAMRAGRFAFFRGACHLFYDRLEEAGFPTDAPPAWSGTRCKKCTSTVRMSGITMASPTPPCRGVAAVSGR